MEDAKLTQVLTELALQLPSAITIVVCIVVVLLRRKRHPAVTTLAAIGLGLILLHGIAFVFIYNWVPELLKSDNTIAGMTSVILVLRIIFNVTRALAYAPLLAAIFIRRPSSESSSS